MVISYEEVKLRIKHESLKERYRTLSEFYIPKSVSDVQIKIGKAMDKTLIDIEKAEKELKPFSTELV